MLLVPMWILTPSRFAYLIKKFSLNLSSLSIVICVNLFHPLTILVPLWFVIISLGFCILSQNSEYKLSLAYLL